VHLLAKQPALKIKKKKVIVKILRGPFILRHPLVLLVDSLALMGIYIAYSPITHVSTFFPDKSESFSLNEYDILNELVKVDYIRMVLSLIFPFDLFLQSHSYSPET
jgi:hypothetical protein